MSNSPLQTDDARRRSLEVVKGLAISLPFSLALVGSPIWGVSIGTLLLGIAAGVQASSPAAQWRFMLSHVGWIVGGTAVGYMAGDIVAHWPDFKRAVVAGWNSV
ncbi:MAG: hypothetical protein KF715_15900 [Candidatus Didemnitutus sp.]|nr:hypothetical protein [Candidatus Didemnitutus sp.]